LSEPVDGDGPSVPSDPIIGIDLGTSNSVVAYADGTGPVQVLVDDGGYKIHPSVVSFHPSGGVVVGAAAKQRKIIDPEHTIYGVKRLIGRGFHAPEVQTARARVPFEIKEGEGQLPMIVTRAGDFAVPEISAIVLDHLRNLAATRLGAEVSRAVITVPASFNDAQRSATATAGAIAGITVVRVLNEPTAAALAYGHAHELRDAIAVYDFGGGTFDVSILKVDGQVYEVLGTAGDTFLGGDDLDERLVDRMVARFLEEHRVDLRADEVAMMRLRAVAEQTKIELSRRTRAVVRIDEIAYGPRGAPLNLQIEIARDELVRDVADLVERTFPVCKEALGLAGLGPDGVSDVLLVGGTTKVPYVREQVSRFFGRPPRTDVGAEDAVAVGAALQAASLQRILARPRGGSRPLPVVGRSEPAQPPPIPGTLPASSAPPPPPQPPPPPVRAAAPGAPTLAIPTLPLAIPTLPLAPPLAPSTPTLPPPAPEPGLSPAGTMRGYGLPTRPPVVLEVTPRGLGIGTVAGYCEELIRRNSRVPATAKKLFTTSRDNQDAVRIVVCQGEARRLDQNVVIGDLFLVGLQPRPRGETSIEVSFSLDASGILQVAARDAATGAEQRAELDLLGGMGREDVAASRDRLQLLRR
jgi:molecular chaperone DnaK